MRKHVCEIVNEFTEREPARQQNVRIAFSRSRQANDIGPAANRSAGEPMV